MSKKLESFRVYLINYQTIGAHAGYGWGRTYEEAKQDALKQARRYDANARFEGGQVWFAGGVNC